MASYRKFMPGVQILSVDTEWYKFVPLKITPRVQYVQ
jgi:hypothetical protein